MSSVALHGHQGTRSIYWARLKRVAAMMPIEMYRGMAPIGVKGIRPMRVRPHMKIGPPIEPRKQHQGDWIPLTERKRNWAKRMGAYSASLSWLFDAI